jgi:hypothetical protein
VICMVREYRNFYELRDKMPDKKDKYQILWKMMMCSESGKCNNIAPEDIRCWECLYV